MTNKQTKIKINSHPGFYTSIIQYQIVTAGNFEINIENIDNIYYLDNIDKMVDSLLRLLLYKKRSIVTPQLLYLDPAASTTKTKIGSALFIRFKFIII